MPPANLLSEPSSPTLQPLTAALLEALTPRDVTRVIIERGMAILGARAGLVAFVTPEGNELALIDSRGYSAETLAPWRRLSLDALVPLADVVRQALPLYMEGLADWEAYYPELIQAAELPPQASVSLPLSVRQHVIGAIHFSFFQARAFSAEDRATLEELARQCSLALDRAQLLQDSQTAERRQTFLARATSILSESLDYPTRLESLARLCVPELADWSGVDLLAEDGSLVHVAVAHRDTVLEAVMHEIQRRFPTDLRAGDQTNRGVVGVIRSGKRLFVPEIRAEMLDSSSLDPEHKSLLKAVGIGAVLILPLTARGYTFGTITLGLVPVTDSREARGFDLETIALAEEIAQRAATAIDNARLFESQRHAAEALQVSDERYRRLLATALEGIMFLDADANIVYVNQRLAEMLAYESPEDLIGQDVFFLFFPEDANFARSRWQARLMGLQEQYELRLRRKDGQPCWTLAHVSIEREEKNGAFQGTFTMLTDITERRRIQEELRASTAEIRTIFERVTDAFSAFDHEWRFVYLNQEAEQILGRTREQLLGKCIWDEFENARDTLVYQQYTYAVREQVSVAFEVYYGPLLGWFEVRAYPSPSGLSAYFRNITERKIAEIDRERSAAEKAELIAELRAASVRQRRFLREMLSSLTEGRLWLCDTTDDLPPPLPLATSPMPIRKGTLRAVRQRSVEVSESIGLSKDRMQDLLTAIGEASMNAVVHAGSGEARISHDGVGRIQVAIVDRGKGIAEDAIHRATLERGYSSAGTLGHGFWIMLKTADRVYLMTSPGGTTVILEQNATPAEPGWLDNPAL